MKSGKVSRRRFLRMIGKSILGTAAACICPPKAFGERIEEGQSSGLQDNSTDDGKKIQITVQDHTLIIR